MTETNEPSYYEIALTNRQVLVSFVVLLTCVLAAFVSGVWVGRKGTNPLPTEAGQLASTESETSEFDQLDEFKFFSDQEKEAAANSGASMNDGASANGGAAESGSGVRELAEPSPPPPAQPKTVPPPVQRQPAPPPPREVTASPPPPRAASPPPPQAVTRQAPAAGTPKEGLVIQVLSTRDEARANRVLTQLRQGGYPAFLSPVKVGTQVNYRVRVGPYQERPPAVKAAGEVNRKYKLDTWITAASN